MPVEPSAANVKTPVSTSQKPGLVENKPVPLCPELQKQIGGGGSPFTSPRNQW